MKEIRFVFTGKQLEEAVLSSHKSVQDGEPPIQQIAELEKNIQQPEPIYFAFDSVSLQEAVVDLCREKSKK